MHGTGRQRRKDELLQEPLVQKTSEMGDNPVNGKRKMNGAIVKVDDASNEKDENIFLFIPNIIGLSRRSPPLAPLIFV